ncbi:cbb3-type cytochrome c oxidase subunit II [Chitinophaga rhizophila]|uniref:Cbb3-type cytochrome c oxidase subunit II n=1 Tax=Chitinophaga rhizophila TaxID=2866212 RepID=A0ABS7GA61_9BACT|nr:cbb3-type cytochrome c oxidase subunit II [Chitinophaga rhizophila]MBW8684534.1 cbb3-type cytochrome c oxidase subunit II [Chitinophaga rhizophila]
MEFFDDHKRLYRTAFLLFIILTLFVAIIPAMTNQHNNAPLPDASSLSAAARSGKALFISNGCVACHTQQVRNVDMDKVWGGRPGIAADYADNHRTDFWRNTATLMGTERTGPDLTDVGNRQPSLDWHLTHLFNPRIVAPASIMPAYPWLFQARDTASISDVIVKVPEEYIPAGTVIVATQDALDLVAYLQELKQVKLPDGVGVPAFLYGSIATTTTAASGTPDGATLYTSNCQSCHQQNGEGLKGAFPSLKGSKVVLDPDPIQLVDVIMNGFDARVSEGYGIMPAVGTNSHLSAEEVTAIMNHERSSWGNNAPAVTTAQVRKYLEEINAKAANK